MEYSFKNCPLNLNLIIEKCDCSECVSVMGIRPGEKITITHECIFGGTVIVKNRFGKFCIRRGEIDAQLKEIL